MSTFIKFFDIFGNSFTPTVSRSSQSESIIGGIFGLFYIVFYFYMFWVFGKDLYYKKKPIQIKELHTNNTRSIDLKLPLGFNVMTKNSIAMSNGSSYKFDVDINRIFTIDAIYKNYTNDQKNYQKQKLKMCDKKEFESNLEFLSEDDEKIINSSVCLDYSQKVILYRRYPYKDRKYIGIYFYECVNSTENNNRCLSQEEKEFYYQHFYFRVYLIHTGLKYSPGNHGHPFERHYKYHDTRLNIYPYFISSHNYVFIENNILDTDDGLFGQNFIKHEHQDVHHQSRHIGGKRYSYFKGKVRKRFFHFSIRLSPNFIYDQRIYIKLQDVIALVTGLMSLLAIGFKYFLQKVYDSKTKELIIHQIFNIDEELIDKKLSERAKKIANNEDKKKEKAIPNVSSREIELNTFKSQLEIANQTRESLYLDHNLSHNNEALIYNKKHITSQANNSIQIPNRSIVGNNLSSLPLRESRPSLALNAILQARLKEEEISKSNFSSKGKALLTNCDHFMLIYCCCILPKRTKKIANYYKGLSNITSEYTDMLTITNNIFEMEKLKFILFDEDQTALFNYRNKVNVKSDIHVSKFLNIKDNFTEYFYFTKNLNNAIDLRELKIELKNRNNRDTMNSKLIKLSS